MTTDGKQVWRAKTIQATAAHGCNHVDGQIIAADERGVVYLIDPANGKTIWNQKLSDYKMRMVAYDELSDKIVAGDDDGKLFMLNMDGKPFYQTAASGSPVRS